MGFSVFWVLVKGREGSPMASGLPDVASRSLSGNSSIKSQ